MDKTEWDLLDKLLCAAYDGKPVTIHRSERGKIMGIEVHDEKQDAAEGGDDGG